MSFQLAVIHHVVSARMASDGFRHDDLHFIRHHTRGMFTPHIVELVDADAERMRADTFDVGLQTTIRESGDGLNRSCYWLNRCGDGLDRGRHRLNGRRDWLDRGCDGLDRGRDRLDRGRDRLDRGRRDRLDRGRRDRLDRGCDRLNGGRDWLDCCGDGLDRGCHRLDRCGDWLNGCRCDSRRSQCGR